MCHCLWIPTKRTVVYTYHLLADSDTKKPNLREYKIDVTTSPSPGVVNPGNRKCFKTTFKILKCVVNPGTKFF